MKVKLLTCLSGKIFCEAGDIIEVDEKTANLMVQRQIAVFQHDKKQGKSGLKPTKSKAKTNENQETATKQ